MMIRPPVVSRALTAIAVASVALFACNRPRWDTPVQAYLSYSRALQKGDANTAWDALSQASQKAFEQKAKAVNEASGGNIPEAPKTLMLSGSASTAPIREVKLVKEEGNVATVSVVPEEGPAKDVRMVKEAGGWKLDVSEMLQN